MMYIAFFCLIAKAVLDVKKQLEAVLIGWNQREKERETQVVYLCFHNYRVAGRGGGGCKIALAVRGC